MRKFKGAIGHPVVDGESAESVGEVGGFVLDRSATKVEAVRIGHGRHARFVPWDDVEAFGDDAAIVKAPADGGDEERREQLAGRPDPLASRVLSTSGFELGEVGDVEFDEGSGDVITVEAGAGSIDVERVRSLGSFALVVDPAD